MSPPSPSQVESWARAEAAIDLGGMREHIRGLPTQLESAAAVAEVAGVIRAEPRAIGVAGMGGSAIAADLAAAYAADRRRLPLAAVRDYRLPAWLDADAFLVASSYSGETEETLSAYREAKSRGTPAVAVTTGGCLAGEARERGDPVIELKAGLPPRAALGLSLAAVAAIVARLDPGLDPAEESERFVRAGEALDPQAARWLAWDAENPALAIAAGIADRVPVVYGAEPIGAAVALRWKTQLNENAKLFAHSAAFPEHNHNEIVGFEGSDPVLERLALVYLETPWDPPRVARRMELARRACDGRVGLQLGARTDSEDRLQGLLWLCLLGDSASFLASVIRGVDPTPVRSIDRLKSELD